MSDTAVNVVAIWANDGELLTKAAAEIEKLRAENAKLAASTHAYLSDYQEARGEIEKLRAALRDIEYLDRPQVRGLPRRKTIQEIARAALGENE